MLAAGCGSDSEEAHRPVKPPELTIPQTTPQAPPTQTETTPTTETAPPSSGGGTAAPTQTETTPQTDTPQNDTPPPTDSAAERFEKFCNDNPGACG